MRILLLSAYDTDSHRAWCQGLLDHCPQLQWTYLTLPGRYFSWRIRGNALSWAHGETRETLQQDYDLVLATSMVDLATLKGLLPNLARTPCVMYFHENQFAYPKSDKQHASIEPQMVNLYSALAADHVFFNSHYNRQTFLDGTQNLLKKLPDFAPLQAIEHVRQLSSVLPVPINEPCTAYQADSNTGTPLSVIWNHRWEYDKGPEVLMEVIQLCEERQLNISFTIAGRSFRSIPECLKLLQTTQPQCVKHIGTFENKQDYIAALSQHHVVLSTAHHEFQGLAMLEACSQGCVPLAPNDLAYPEWIPSSGLYPTNKDPKEQAKAILERLLQWQQQGLPSRPDVSAYFWPQMAKEYASKLLKIQEETQV